MPFYSWTGMSKDASVSGQIEAKSRERAMAALEARGIRVLSLEDSAQAGSGRSRTSAGAARSGIAVRLVFGLALMAGAFLIGTIDRGIVVSCSRSSTAGSCSCEVETSIAGVYPLYREQILRVESVVAENKIIESRDSKTGKYSTAKYEHLIFKGDGRTVSTELMAFPVGGKSRAIEEEYYRFLSSSGLEFRAWQIEGTWLLVAAILGLVSIAFFWSALRRLFA